MRLLSKKISARISRKRRSRYAGPAVLVIGLLLTGGLYAMFAPANADQKTNVWWLGGDWNITPSLNLALGFYDQQSKQSDDYVATSAANPTPAKGSQANGNIYSYSALLDYHFSKRSDVYTGLMYSQYKGDQWSSSVYNDNNYIFAVGMRHKF